MAYRPAGRSAFVFMARTPTGWKQLGTGATNRKAAERVEVLWDALARQHMAWDILGEVLAKRRTVAELVAGWEAARHEVAALRAVFFPPVPVADPDVAAVVDAWAARYRQQVRPDSAAHAIAHVRWLLPPDHPRPASSVTPAWLHERLYAYRPPHFRSRTVKRNTLRKVHSSWSVFFTYATDVVGLFPWSPMAKVPRPRLQASPVAYYTQDEAEAIVDAQPTPERRAYFALAYGTGCDVSVALRLRRADVWNDTREIRAAGTKAYNRDRVARVADWAWPVLADHGRGMLPTARLFPADWTRHTVSQWHRETVTALVEVGGLRDVLPLRNARHHWAVRATKAGAPCQVVAAQLGHGSPQLVLTVYGRFAPGTVDRNRWEAAATEAERARRDAQPTAAHG